MKRKKIVVLSIFLLAAVVLLHNKSEKKNSLQESLSNEVIRLHVVADNDTKVAQEFKLKVRDEVLVYLKTLINDEENIETTRKIIYDNLKLIEEVAKSVAKDEKCNYEIEAVLCNDYFPIKEYGTIVFPAGYYQALKINIGKAQGQNWWCVMYPNLCFVDGTYAIIDEKTKKEIKKILTDEEYEMLLEASEVKVRFKSLEIIEDIWKKINRYYMN